ncbi:hypothetical protein SAMN06265795_103233 [Noviherbaspirillum humi]|uniref:Uncharacterized protein n=1 Tax=Noviherbaspirillum humi TaxID=1688639 RepID=A0A239F868_9BURK|nr:hypothetical protein [Noviherbaspirillum humi]SNS53086.1 hypothetical protein SAMN06265795_103233 [Noviherbaspirillum humi]
MPTNHALLPYDAWPLRWLAAGLMLCSAAAHAQTELVCRPQPAGRSGPISIQFCEDRLGDPVLRIRNLDRKQAMQPDMHGCDLRLADGRTMRASWRVFPIEPGAEHLEYDIFRRMGKVESVACAIRSVSVVPDQVGPPEDSPALLGARVGTQKPDRMRSARTEMSDSPPVVIQAYPMLGQPPAAGQPATGMPQSPAMPVAPAPVRRVPAR